MIDLLPGFLGHIISAVLVGIVLIFAWRARRSSQKTLVFQWSLCLTLATTLLVIRYSPYNLVLLLPGIMMLLRAGRQLWQRNRVYRLLCSISALAVFWPFLAAVCLVIALAFVPESIERKAWGAPFYPTYTIPIMIYALLLISREVLSEGRVGEVAE